MDNKFKYQRSFLIFDEEDNGYGAQQTPSGHIKIEIREGKGKLFCQVNNLSDDNGKIEYRLFLIKSDELQIVPVFVGKIELKKNRGEIEWSFETNNISKTDLAFDKFNVIAVLANYSGRKSDHTICPLAAYKDGKVEWRQKLNDVLQEEKLDEKMLNQNKEVGDGPNKYIKENFESINKKEESIKINDSIEKEQSKAGNSQIITKVNNLMSEQITEDIEKNICEAEKELEQNPKKDINYFENNKKDNKTEYIEEKPEEQKPLEEKANEEKPIKDQIYGKSYSSFDGSKLFNMYTGESKDNINLNTDCMNCIFLNNKNIDKPKINEFRVEELSKEFDLTFEKCMPFSVKRADYNWWKATSPVHLNNILYKFGIKIPVLFNPLVLMAHYKYNHLIVGVYQDDIRQKDYIVFGIPGVYWVDEKPFGNACRWAQVEGNTPTYGAYGYWIVYINPKTGKILAIEE